MLQEVDQAQQKEICMITHIFACTYIRNIKMVEHISIEIEWLSWLGTSRNRKIRSNITNFGYAEHMRVRITWVAEVWFKNTVSTVF